MLVRNLTALNILQKEFVMRNLWSAHEEAIRLCEEEGLHQAVYFLRRDLNFIKEVKYLNVGVNTRLDLPMGAV